MGSCVLIHHSTYRLPQCKFINGEWHWIVTLFLFLQVIMGAMNNLSCQPCYVTANQAGKSSGCCDKVYESKVMLIWHEPFHLKRVYVDYLALNFRIWSNDYCAITAVLWLPLCAFAIWSSCDHIGRLSCDTCYKLKHLHLFYYGETLSVSLSSLFWGSLAVTDTFTLGWGQKYFWEMVQPPFMCFCMCL